MSVQLNLPHSAFTIKQSHIQREIISPCQVKNYLEDCPPLDGTALWDTGATNSVVSKAFAVKLRLQPIGQRKVQGVHGSEIVNTYLADIGLPNKVIFKGVDILEADIGDRIDVLIGMDIIGSGDFSICGGKVFSYSIPPFDTPIDFVVKADKVNPKVIKRNQKIMRKQGV